MLEPEDRKRFEDLLGRLIDDELGKAGLTELAQLVGDHSELLDELRLHLLVDSRLSEYENPQRSAEAFAATMTACLEADANADDFIGKVVDFAEAENGDHERRTRRLPWIVASASALAACLALTLLVLGVLSPGLSVFAGPEPVDDGVAVVSTMVGKAKHDGELIEIGDSVSPGVILLRDGYLELEFYRGARVTVAGPAELELVNAERAICRRGKIRATVPAVAKGFTIATPDSEVVDLGTEFGLEVSDKGKTQVHVFDGEVELYDTDRAPDSRRLLTTGVAMRASDSAEWETIPAEDARFSDLTRINAIEASSNEARFARWQALSDSLRQDERLIVYYPFERGQGKMKRALVNHAPTGSQFDGAIVGARWSSGPWSDKKSLEFKRPGDRVRIDIPGEFEAVTLAAWVRVDGLDRSHSSLMLTDEYDPGEIHWQFRGDGAFLIGMRHAEEQGHNYVAKDILDYNRLGRWMHVATVYNPEAATVTHFLNGDAVASEKVKVATSVRIGSADIGNWSRPVNEGTSAIRNFNGRMAEFMIFKTSLSESEIRRIALLEE